MAYNFENYIEQISEFLTVGDLKEVVLVNKYICDKIQPKLYKQAIVPWEHVGNFYGIKFSNDFNEHVELPNHLHTIKLSPNFNKPIDLSGLKKLSKVYIWWSNQKKLLIDISDKCKIITYYTKSIITNILLISDGSMVYRYST